MLIKKSSNYDIEYERVEVVIAMFVIAAKKIGSPFFRFLSG